MNNFKTFLILFSGLILGATQVSCSPGSGDTRSLAASVKFPTTLSGDNVIPLSVGACGVHGYQNEPCISVTICRPNTTQCQTIDNILVDTGSYGLKIFRSLLTISLDQIPAPNDSAQGLASCTGYLDGSGHWGQVVKADVKLGNKKTTTSGGIPIVTLDGTYSQYTKCGSKPDKSPADAGFNGIIGVGSFVEDCSVGYGLGVNGCVAAPTKKYWSCTSTTCTQTNVPLASQIANPVAKMPAGYNNGIVIKLPDVPISGAGAAYGYMILGIGTSGDVNNAGTGLTVFPQSYDATFVTRYKNVDYEYAFIDSGTNFNGFPRINGFPALCSSGSDFYCPVSLENVTATMKSGSVTKDITFEVGNMITLASADPYSMVYRNIAFDSTDLQNVAGDIPFDWGLPFFLGRSVYVGIYGTTATINNGTTVSGPFWAF
ncbi:DUF3443 family protein [Bdellovibrio sp. HCB274]|uniref:DUF3443 family protein n=1 Tax=Bdellovibrio sp. HCB274 TaxID=3394361 RepID=UPI0039B58ACD